MSARLFTTSDLTPTGFESERPRRRDLLAGAVAVLASDRAEIEELLGDAFDRFRGIVVVTGPVLELQREAPMRYEMTVPESELERLHALVTPILDAIEEAGSAADRAAELEFVTLRTRRELESTRADYTRLTSRLTDQIKALTETESLLRTSERAVRKWSQRLEDRVDERTTELQSANAALRDAIKAAERANEAKGLFLATMSHEIRTPLGGIHGVLELLADSKLGSEQRRLLETAQGSASSLMEIVDDILDAAKLDAGKLSIELTPFDLLGLVEAVVETLAPNATRKGIEFHCHVARDVPASVVSDPTRIRQVLFNLCSNAVKFTSTTPERIGVVALDVRVDASSDEGARILFAVTDSGIGMDEETVSRLFVPYTQADPSTTRRFGGTGLGLSICKDLVGLMEGTIRVTSEPGVGSRFEVTLPIEIGSVDATSGEVTLEVTDFDVELAIPAGVLRDTLADYAESVGASVRIVDDPADIDIRPKYERHLAIVVLEERSAGLIARLDELAKREPLTSRPGVVLITPRDKRLDAVPDDCVTFAAPPVSKGRFGDSLRIAAGLASDASPYGRAEEESARESSPELSPDAPLVLLVEDDETNREVVFHQLRRLGIASVTAANGVEAMRLFRERPIALVLTDCHMPEMDGFALAAEIRAAEASIGTRLPILALTASAVRAEAEQCFAAGMDGCFRKPIELESLRRVMATWLPAVRAVAPPKEPPPTFAVRTDEFDPDALRRAVGGNFTAHPNIIRMYLESAGSSIGVLERALGARDRAALAFEAHKLRSSSLTVGAIAVGTLCERIERSASNEPEWTRLAELVVGAEKEFVRVTPMLIEWSDRPR